MADKEENYNESVKDTTDEGVTDTINNTIVEVIRNSNYTTCKPNLNISWDYNISWDKTEINDKTPPFVSAMADTSPFQSVKLDTSTQTESSLLLESSHAPNIKLSFGKGYNSNGSSSDNSDQSIDSNRINIDLNDFEKKDKISSKNMYSSTSDSISSKKRRLTKTSSIIYSSASETSFISANSNHSFKIRKRRLKSETSVYKDALQKSRISSKNSLLGGTPGKERSQRRNKAKTWKIMDLCAWIGMKGIQSLTGISDYIREPTSSKDKVSAFLKEMKEMKTIMDEMYNKQLQLIEENELLQNEMKKMKTKIEEIEGKQSCVSNIPKAPQIPPPPPPPPPPLPPPPQPQTANSKLGRANTIPRRGSAPPRISGPRLTITPQDIANVKLRKTKDNPVRTKPPMIKEGKQPLVTQQMLQSTRAKLGRTRPMAASTPKQQLTDLEKCLLQDSCVSPLYRRRVTRSSFRSAEELRMRPYPAPSATRSPRTTPHSPRSSSIPRCKPISPIKFCALEGQI